MLIDDNIIKASKVKQGNLEFLVSVFSIKHILRFTKYTKRLIVSYDEENMPIYNDEIQRTVESSRVEKIADFLINDPDATFPTNIVISIPQAVIENFEDKGNQVELLLSNSVFSEIQKQEGHVHLTIIDGQHRIRGIERAIERLNADIKNLSKVLTTSTNSDLEKKRDTSYKLLNNLLRIELIVSFFIDPTLEFQAMIVYSLFGLTSNDSPQKSALQIVLSLNGYEKSPFFNRIKLYGGKYARNQSPPLTQATMVKTIIDKICVNLRDSENDRFRNRKELLKNGSPDLCFRYYYAKNQDDFISDILFAYFTAVRNVFTDENNKSFWDFEENTKSTNVLQATVGYRALLEILTQILIQEPSDEKRDKVETYESYLVKAKGLVFADQQRYPFTSISKTILYLDMHLKIWPPTNTSDERLIRLDQALKQR
jgi:DGQHR domain-containing protein